MSNEFHLTDPSDRRWYAVHSAPQKEPFAEANLANQDFVVFLPRIRKTTRHARKTQTVLAPLFPRYLFVHLDLARDRWRSIFGTRGVHTMLMAGERPQAVPVGIVETLANQRADDGHVKPPASLTLGQNVEFLYGPFAGILGKVAALDERGRVRVLLSMMGAERVVSASAENLLAQDVA